MVSECQILETSTHQLFIDDYSDLDQQLVLENHHLGLALGFEIGIYTDQLFQNAIFGAEEESWTRSPASAEDVVFPRGIYSSIS